MKNVTDSQSSLTTSITGWAQPYNVAPPESAAPGAVSAHSRHVDHVDVFWIGPDNSVRGNWWHKDHGWNGQYKVAPKFSAAAEAIAAHSRNVDHIGVFWITENGSVRENQWSKNGDWSGPFTIAADTGDLRALPEAVTSHSRHVDHIDVFWIARDKSIRGTWWHAGEGWVNPYSVAPADSASAGPGAITAHSRHVDHIDLFWIGLDGSVCSAWWHNGVGWKAPYQIAPAGSAAPWAISAHSRHVDHIDLFWVAPDGSVRGNWWHKGVGWKGQYAIAAAGSATFGPATGAITAHSRHVDHIDLFWIGPDKSVRGTWWHQ
jgi:hypothetical protein